MGAGLRVLLWLFSTSTGSVLTIGVLLAFALALGHVGPLNAGSAILMLPVVLVVGVFVAVIAVTETSKTYRHSGARIRMVTGAAAGAAIAVMLAAPFEGVALGTLVGLALGYLGKLWAQYF